jgi:hypothetical protein
MTPRELGLPDTKLVTEALGAARHALAAPMLSHSVRAYLLATAYAKSTSRDHDDEGLCLAALFHDVGMSPSHRGAGAFTLASSSALTSFLEARDVPRERIAPLVDAIDFHMQLFPRWSKGNVVGLLQVGAWMDVMGFRRARVRDDAKRIEELLPRDGFTSAFHRGLLSTLRSPSACLGLLFPESFRKSAA